MVALRMLRWCLVYLSVLITLANTGCASLGGMDHDPYVSAGAQDYPVKFIAAPFAPADPPIRSDRLNVSRAGTQSASPWQLNGMTHSGCRCGKTGYCA